MRMLDLFCGRWGWSKSFALRGWECVGVDLVRPSEIPENCKFYAANVFDLWMSSKGWLHHNNDFACMSEPFDFICASPPCEQFSVHGMKHFHPNAPYPELGVLLFRYTETICERSGLPYVIENVRAAQKFVGIAARHCGPFYLWGTGVPALIHRGIGKDMSQQRDKNGQRRGRLEHVSKKERAAQGATIPPELASCVAQYAERVIEQRAMAR